MKQLVLTSYYEDKWTVLDFRRSPGGRVFHFSYSSNKRVHTTAPISILFKVCTCSTGNMLIIFDVAERSSLSLVVEGRGCERV